MSGVFDAYARYYDLLYSDKDYSAEAEYVAARIRKYAPRARSVLELGCGTGAHAEALARLGFEVTGVDLSAKMVARANERRSNLPAELARCISFSEGDLRLLRSGREFDVAISLFHVMSYQTDNSDLLAALETADAHLRPGGLFLFDFWHGGAVLSQKPEVRIKRLEDRAVRITRIAEPTVHATRNVVDVEFTVFVEDKASGDIRQFRELHPMRYLFLPELQQMASARFELLDACGWMTSRDMGMDDWAGCVMLRKRDAEAP